MGRRGGVVVSAGAHIQRLSPQRGRPGFESSLRSFAACHSPSLALSPIQLCHCHKGIKAPKKYFKKMFCAKSKQMYSTYEIRLYTKKPGGYMQVGWGRKWKQEGQNISVWHTNTVKYDTILYRYPMFTLNVFQAAITEIAVMLSIYFETPL